MRIAVATIGSNGDVMPFVWRLNPQRLARALSRVRSDGRFVAASRAVAAAMSAEDGAGDAAGQIAVWAGAPRSDAARLPNNEIHHRSGRNPP